MPDRDPFSERAQLEDALREHYAREARLASYPPISGPGIRERARAPRPRQGRWLAVAVAAVVVAVSGIGVSGLFSRTVPAVPGPTPTPTTTAAPAPGTSWTMRVTAPIAVDQYAQVNLDDASYLLAGGAAGQDCRLDAYRYAPAIDQWQALPEGPARNGASCDQASAFVQGEQIYLVIADAAAPGLYAFHTGDQTWRTLDWPEAATCDPVGLGSGILCLQPGGTASPLAYRFFDYAAGTWTAGSVEVGQGGESVTAHAVELDGQALVLVSVTQAGGGQELVILDPGQAKVIRRTSHAGTGHTLEAPQVTSDGFAFLGPVPDGATDPAAGTGLVVDLRSGTWSEVEVPLPGGPLQQQHPSDAAWVLLHYPEATDQVLSGGYLYRPSDGRWLAVAPLPEVEPGQSLSGDVYTWVGSSVLCRRAEPNNCWGLTAPGLEGVVTAVDPAAITASNDQAR